MQILPSGFGATTIPVHQSVGMSTLEMMLLVLTFTMHTALAFWRENFWDVCAHLTSRFLSNLRFRASFLLAMNAVLTSPPVFRLHLHFTFRVVL